MRTELPCVTPQQHLLIQQTISRLVEATHPEKIICYGLRIKNNMKWSSFPDQVESESGISLDLLIIILDKDKRKRENVCDHADTISNDMVRLITVVHSVDAVNENLENGNLFFTTLYQSGILIYDHNTTPLSEPALKTISETFTMANRRKGDLARLFFETACDAMQKERHEIAVFALHQAVELTCTALLRTCLGYKPNTHSINKLFMLLENTPVRIDSIFPRTAAEDVAVFNILQRGYSDVRYKEEYSVTGDKVTMLIARVRQFQIAAFRLCQNQWNHPTSTP